MSEKMFSGEQRAAGVAPRLRALTLEIDDTSSPVRQFLGERFTCGLKDLQRRFRPVPGNGADPEHLARACWALALFTEVFRAGPAATAHGPLALFRGRRPSAAELLDLAPPAALGQLAAFRHVFETALLPELAARRGTWRLGPLFAGSALIPADADLIAAGLLLELKTSARLTLAVKDLFQVIGYALADSHAPEPAAIT